MNVVCSRKVPLHLRVCFALCHRPVVHNAVARQSGHAGPWRRERAAPELTLAAAGTADAKHGSHEDQHQRRSDGDCREVVHAKLWTALDVQNAGNIDKNIIIDSEKRYLKSESQQRAVAERRDADSSQPN